MNNLLSSCYGYCEHSTKYWHDCGTSQFKNIKDKHINSDDLRIVDEILNHSQHAGQPIHRVKIENDEVQLIFEMNKASFDKKHKEELIKKFENCDINLMPHIVEYIHALYRIHEEVIIALSKMVNQSFEIINTAISQMKDLSGDANLSTTNIVRVDGDNIEKSLLHHEYEKNYNYYYEEVRSLYGRLFDL